jgi:protocatechuate 3,4-dioxygenase alpha subunit
VPDGSGPDGLRLRPRPDPEWALAYQFDIVRAGARRRRWRTLDGHTPSQTVGPFFAIELPFGDGPLVVREGADGAIWLRGRVLDGAGDPVPDALIETWQTSPPPGPGFRGFARCATDEAGRYAIRTRKPGPVPGPDGAPQAPHLAVSVFARGLLDRVVTRVYFGDESNAPPIPATVDRTGGRR